MRKLILTAAAILLVNSMGWSANAATTAPVSAIPGAARNFSPVHEAPAGATADGADQAM
jgi:hypothetical protein